MNQRSACFVDEMTSPIGPLTIVASEQGVCHLHFGTIESIHSTLRAKLLKLGMSGEWQQCSDTLSSAIEQLSEYFSGKRQAFDLPLDLCGTQFQKRVWKELSVIEFGQTRSYKEIAEAIGAPKAVRAIGGANNRNPVPIIVPCHRVIGSNGSMVGYGGGLDKKEMLLIHEGSREEVLAL
ncbi:methylated-DNA--[protein]-cysteine S-methyltransferase [Alkalicoccobacillus gibsonii]|jgi:methylated-DNA-[protein]-cysteine S-methyltransferase|uniref:methylated-DNA--[protein]-cysteine S-methyltransferase n=1 Tax=Alkalicoccobacillus gibsonii TaxID=79881 RepID=UPI0019332344|nr:methylated-DNA--[protein]-cysteine S-methyltransferase [Alkalicoccobacillus gibsonii]MBM0064054.1 methylated-DNA--[protein]-cysteine S-methyltransferase [Alkalicoccobacillus gibsonii]